MHDGEPRGPACVQLRRVVPAAAARLDQEPGARAARWLCRLPARGQRRHLHPAAVRRRLGRWLDRLERRRGRRGLGRRAHATAGLWLRHGRALRTGRRGNRRARRRGLPQDELEQPARLGVGARWLAQVRRRAGRRHAAQVLAARGARPARARGRSGRRRRWGGVGQVGARPSQLEQPAPGRRVPLLRARRRGVRHLPARPLHALRAPRGGARGVAREARQLCARLPRLGRRIRRRRPRVRGGRVRGLWEARPSPRPLALR
mmetsp:Transcript_24898/g.63106  ORF Transcript_24898/g.63106 Transcript_24898/m.63106 type:complete len:261 (+) Transcript_24898:131-913(+)